MGNPQPGCRLRHAAGVGDRHQDMKVAQLDAAANSVRPVHRSLNLGVTGMSLFSVYQIMAGPARLALFGPSRRTRMRMIPLITKRRFVSLACTGGLAAILPDTHRTALAETNARLLVGFSAGAAIDLIARILVEGMKDYA